MVRVHMCMCVCTCACVCMCDYSRTWRTSSVNQRGLHHASPGPVSCPRREGLAFLPPKVTGLPHCGPQPCRPPLDTLPTPDPGASPAGAGSPGKGRGGWRTGAQVPSMRGRVRQGECRHCPPASRLSSQPGGRGVLQTHPRACTPQASSPGRLGLSQGRRAGASPLAPSPLTSV